MFHIRPISIDKVPLISNKAPGIKVRQVMVHITIEIMYVFGPKVSVCVANGIIRKYERIGMKTRSKITRLKIRLAFVLEEIFSICCLSAKSMSRKTPLEKSGVNTMPIPPDAKPIPNTAPKTVDPVMEVNI